LLLISHGLDVNEDVAVRRFALRSWLVPSPWPNGCPTDFCKPWAWSITRRPSGGVSGSPLQNLAKICGTPLHNRLRNVMAIVTSCRSSVSFWVDLISFASTIQEFFNTLVFSAKSWNKQSTLNYYPNRWRLPCDYQS